MEEDMDKESEPFLEKNQLVVRYNLEREIMRTYVFHSYSDLH